MFGCHRRQRTTPDRCDNRVLMNWSAIAAAALGLAVIFGAFGAHALKGRLDDYAMGVYEKAVFYHFIHALGLLIVAPLAKLGSLSESSASTVGWLLSWNSAVLRQSLCACAERSAHTWRDHSSRGTLFHRRLVFARLPSCARQIATSDCLSLSAIDIDQRSV